MTLTTKRGSATTKVSEFQSLVAGSHDPAQRTAKLSEIATAYGDVGGEVVRARASDRTSTTDAFYASSIETVCGNFDSFHKITGGTNMYEMFCRPAPLPPKPEPGAVYGTSLEDLFNRSTYLDVAETNIASWDYTGVSSTLNMFYWVVGGGECVSPPTRPNFQSGPLVMTYVAGSNTNVFLFGFEGSIEYDDGTTVVYDTPTDIFQLNIPDSGDGYGTLRLRGRIDNSDHHLHPAFWSVDRYQVKDIVNIWQWGHECVIGSYVRFASVCTHPCFTVSATDQPWFGVQ